MISWISNSCCWKPVFFTPNIHSIEAHMVFVVICSFFLTTLSVQFLYQSTWIVATFLFCSAFSYALLKALYWEWTRTKYCIKTSSSSISFFFKMNTFSCRVTFLLTFVFHLEKAFALLVLSCLTLCHLLYIIVLSMLVALILSAISSISS